MNTATNNAETRLFHLTTASGKSLGMHPGVDASDAIARCERSLAEERAKRDAKFAAHVAMVEARRARVDGPPKATWTLTPIPFDPWAD